MNKLWLKIPQQRSNDHEFVGVKSFIQPQDQPNVSLYKSIYLLYIQLYVFVDSIKGYFLIKAVTNYFNSIKGYFFLIKNPLISLQSMV